MSIFKTVLLKQDLYGTTEYPAPHTVYQTAGRDRFKEKQKKKKKCLQKWYIWAKCLNNSD